MNSQARPNKNILYGVISLAAGIGLIYFFIWRPLEAMAQKQDNLTYSVKGVGFGPFLVMLGLYLLILRPPSLKPGEMSLRQRVVYWVMVGLSVVLGIVAFLWFKQRAAQLGYTV
jgi:type II secretory pathway component PulM